MAYTLIPPSTTGGDVAKSYYFQRALALTGVLSSDKNYGFVFDDFDHSQASLTVGLGWLNATTTSGATAARNASTNGGVIQLTSGASANSSEDITSLEILVSNLTTQKWYFASRAKATTTPDAQSTLCAGLFNSAGTSICAGVFGSASTTLFQLQYDGSLPAGSFLSLATTIDTNAHVFEIYSKGENNNKIYARCDEGAELSVTAAANPTTGMYLIGRAANGTTAAAQTTQIDFMSMLFPR